MTWDKLIGPASIIYMLTTLIGGIWWASDISTRMSSTEDARTEIKQDIATIRSDVALLRATDGRITRVETLLTAVDKQMDRIETKLDRSASR